MYLPKVSVCMIAYRHEAFIRQAIESVLSQEVDFGLELVIGDDCSPDGTTAICEEYARRDTRVRLLPCERNLGLMANFTRTLQACRGDYIAVCEGDDYWTDPQKLRKQVQFLDEHFDYAGAAHQSLVIANSIPDRVFKKGVPATLLTNDLLGGRLFHTASILFRRPIVKIFSGSPPVISCDRLLNLCISITGKIGYSEESMCVYRRHAAGMSSNVTADELKMDLNSIFYLCSVSANFPKIRYRSYIYATIGLCSKSPFRDRLFYSILAAIMSFSYFPRNIVQAAYWVLSRIKNYRKSRQESRAVDSVTFGDT